MLSLPSPILRDPAESSSRFWNTPNVSNLTSEYFALKRTSFSDAFIIKTIRLYTTVVLHRSPTEDLNQENWSSTHFYWFESPKCSRKSLSGEAWKPVQVPDMAANRLHLYREVSCLVVVLFRVNCTIPTLSKSKAVRGKYCIVLPGEGNEFLPSTKDTLISKRVIYVPSGIIRSLS